MSGKNARRRARRAKGGEVVFLELWLLLHACHTREPNRPQSKARPDLRNTTSSQQTYLQPHNHTLTRTRRTVRAPKLKPHTRTEMHICAAHVCAPNTSQRNTSMLHDVLRRLVLPSAAQAISSWGVFVAWLRSWFCILWCRGQICMSRSVRCW